MATVTFDSELMQHYVAAVSVPDSSRFMTVTDSSKAPMTFSVGNDKTLYLIKTGSSGANELINFGQKLGYDETIDFLDFGLSQSSDGSLYMALVIQDQGTKMLQVTKAFLASDLDDDDADLSKLIVPHMYDSKEGLVERVMVGSCGPDEDYPLVLVTFKVPNEIKSEEDIARVDMNSDQTNWVLSSDVEVPENADAIYDICPATIDLDPGYMALYKNQDKTCLIFIGTEKHFEEVTHVPVPCTQGAGVLATCLNSTSYNDVLVGGDELQYYTSRKVGNGKRGKRLTKDGVFSSSTQLFCSQSDAQNVTVWATSSNHGIGYASTASAFKQGVGTPIQLIPNGRAGRFSPFMDPVTQTQQFMIASDSGQLSLLFQDTPRTGLWKQMPYYTPILDKNVEFTSYFVHCTVQDENKNPLGNTTVLLQCSSYTSIHINGKTIDLGPAGVHVVTDKRGSLDLVIPSEDVSSFTYLVRDVDGGTIFNGVAQPMIPDENIHRRLSSIKSGQDLKDATLQSGAPLLDSDNQLSVSDLNDVAAAVQKLEEVRIEKLEEERKQLADAAASASASASAPFTSFPTKPGPTSPKAHHETPDDDDDDDYDDKETLASEIDTKFGRPSKLPIRLHRTELICGHNLDILVQAASTGDGVIAMLWAIQTAGDVYYFVISVGGAVYRWVVDTVASVGKILSSIFDKVLKVAEKVVDWLGFIFSWADIQATHRSMTEDDVKDFFEKIKNAINSMEKLPDGISGKSIDSSVDSDEKREAQKQAVIKSAPANFSFYQFTFGGAGETSLLDGDFDDDSDDDSDVDQNALTDVILPAANSIKDTIKKLVDDIVELFDDKGTGLTVGQILEKISIDVVVGFVDCFETVAIGLLELFESLIKTLRKFANFKIDVPVYSALYKQYVSGGDDLTVLDVAALIFAIPVTIVHKILTGKAPADLTQLDYGKLVSGDVSTDEYTTGVNWFLGVIDLLGTYFMGSFGGIAGLIPEEGAMAVVPSAQTRAFRGTAIQLIHLGESGAFARALMSERALSRLRSPHPLRTLFCRWKGSGQPFEKRVWMLATDWHTIIIVKLFLRAGTTPVRDDPNEPGYEFRWLSWAGSLTGDAAYVYLHLCADQLQAWDDGKRERARELIVPLAVISTAQAVYGFIMDLITVIEAWNSQSLIDSLCDGIGSAALTLSTTCSNVAIVDPDEETSLAISIGSYGGLSIGMALKGGKFIYDHYDERYVRFAIQYAVPASIDAFLLF
ncbi:hypothetical protein CC80DRAFT_582168 [Byssothecium circinans]|uniref:Uncharacterized protein n=1 Tax=Byssothecium circinans TaxID=147558 RepID=A0A6A5TB76_9PLEO|nr:hypothetical protein CC80DRAFT_582168 [Byssothecium circinans]